MTPAELRAHVETDLTDPALQRLIDAAETEIAQVAGPVSEITESHDPEGHDAIFLDYVIGSGGVTKVEERSNDTWSEVTDYWIQGRRELVRNSGTWSLPTRVTYTPAGRTELRESVLVELVRMMVEHRAPVSETSGGTYRADYSGMEERRNKALRRLRRELLPLL